MDNTALDLFRKILKELGDIERLIHDAILLPRQRQSSSESYKQESHNGERESDVKVAPRVKASAGHEDAPKNKHERRRKWLTEHAVELVGVIIVAIYSGVTAAQWRAVVDSNKITRESLHAAHDNFRQDQRPYIWLTNNLLWPHYFEPGGFPVWEWHYINYGKSPAYKIRITSNVIHGVGARGRPRPLPPVMKSAPMPTGKDDFSTAVPMLGEKITKNEFAGLLTADDGTILVYGRIEYSDNYGGDYVTRFCFYTLTAGAVAYCEEDSANDIK